MSADDLTVAELRRAVERSGCYVEKRIENGIPITKIVAPDGWGAARLLTELCDADFGKPAVAAAAKILREGASSDEDYARRVHCFVKRTIRFAVEEGEIFQSPHYTAQTGVGDCDDHARVVVALLRAGGVKARLAFLHAGNGPRHVVAQAFVDGDWQWLETTCDAEFGEHPFAAAKRLGIVRTDIKSEVVTMGEVCQHAPMAGIPSDAFLVAGAAMSKRLNVSWPDLLKVMNNESGINPAAQNPGGAAGLIQFDPPPPGITSLSAEQQLPFVESFLRANAKKGLHSVARIYQSIFLPGTLDTIHSGVLVRRGGTGFGGAEASFYAGNSGFDRTHKGFITVEDLGVTAELAAARPNSPYQQALARLRIVAPGSIPGISFGKVIVAMVAAGGLFSIVHAQRPDLTRPVLRYVQNTRNIFG